MASASDRAATVPAYCGKYALPAVVASEASVALDDAGVLLEELGCLRVKAPERLSAFCHNYRVDAGFPSGV